MTTPKTTPANPTPSAPGPFTASLVDGEYTILSLDGGNVAVVTGDNREIWLANPASGAYRRSSLSSRQHGEILQAVMRADRRISLE